MSHHHHHHPHPRPLAPPFSVRLRHLRLDTSFHRSRTVSTVTLTWEIPVARTDGTPLGPDEIASIDVFDDLGDGTGAQKIGSVTGAGTTFTTQTLSVGSHTFTEVVNDTTGHKSAASAPTPVTIPATLANPNPVTNVQATINP